MKYTIGPIVVLDTDPPRKRQSIWSQPVEPGNQATWLFFPVFASLVLVIISSLSIPIIEGLSIVDVDAGRNGTLQVGAWGSCWKGTVNATDKCSAVRSFPSSMDNEVSQWPESLTGLSGIKDAVPHPYLAARGAFEIINGIISWTTALMTLAASGAWQAQDQKGWQWTIWAFAMSFWSAVFSFISLFLNLGEYIRVQHHVKGLAGDIAKANVTPGGVIWIMLAAFLLNLVAFLFRISWGKFRPRPTWSVKENKVDEAARSAPEEMAKQPLPDYSTADEPPTWDSLKIDTDETIDEKATFDTTVTDADKIPHAV